MQAGSTMFDNNNNMPTFDAEGKDGTEPSKSVSSISSTRVTYCEHTNHQADPLIFHTSLLLFSLASPYTIDIPYPPTELV